MLAEIGAELAKNAIGIFFDILDILLSLLPMAPFRAMLSQIEGIEVLGYVNYFIPFDFAAKCLNTWLACVLAYYIYKFLKQAIDDYRSKSKL